MKLYKSKKTDAEYSCNEYVNHGYGDNHISDHNTPLLKDLPLNEYPFDIIEKEDFVEHPHGFNICVMYYDESSPKLVSEHSTYGILWNVITLYYHEYFDELADLKKQLSESTHFMFPYLNTCINFVVNEMAAFCNEHKVKNPEKIDEMMPLPITEYPIWMNNLEELLCELTWGKKDRKILIGEVLPRLLNTFIHYKDALELSDFSVIESNAVEKIIDDVIVKFPDKVKSYKSGKIGLINMLFGEVMKASGGKIDMKEARILLEKKLV